MTQLLSTPRHPVAPGTSDIELDRLARMESSHPDCDPLTAQALIWLVRAANAVVNAQADELRPLGLSPSGWNVLVALHNTEGHILEPCQLADRLVVSRPSITGLLDTLQAKGLIIRQPHSDDRRRVLVHLTAAGMQVLREHFAAFYEHQRSALQGLSEADRMSLVELLRNVTGAAPADTVVPAPADTVVPAAADTVMPAAVG